ncbi:MAG: DUF475 domain-containing protein [Bacteroidetes bacterium]|nr:DUF475 domain-containing protein [Bacteroidota bacterium]
MMDFWGIPWPKALLTVGNLVLLETLVSVDNAAVMASMAMRLPEHQRGKALRYGLIGAYVFRGLCLLLAGWMLNLWWIKPLGGAYLLYLAYRHFGSNGGGIIEGVEGRQGKHQGFWWTVLSIELMDLAFSVDNVLVAVAFADPGLQASPEQKQGALILLYFGVFIGILAMRFVAQYFIGLMERYPRLEHSAYLVIGILGLKLCLGDWVAVRADDLPMIGSALGHPESGHWADMGFSMLTLAVFAWPLLVGRRSARRKNRSEVS